MSAMKIPNGALTALITPFNWDGTIDWTGLKELIEFQERGGIAGLVPVGTTGESPTLTEVQHQAVLSRALKLRRVFVLAGCGSNSTAEAMQYVYHTRQNGGKAVLLVDPYYNGPSSLEIKREYYGPIAEAFPDVAIIPYIIPGRTGCALSPEDLAELNREFPNICGVKEATGDLTRMVRTRALTSPDFQIFSGDDDKTFEMMTASNIKSCGVISVATNIAPAAVQAMCQAILDGNIATAEKMRDKLKPLFGIVTVLADRNIPCRFTGTKTLTDKFRNPLPIKTAMNLLGMPAGPCRQPLGKMTRAGVQIVRDALAAVWERNPEVLEPIEDFFKRDISGRLADDQLLAKFAY